MEIQLDNRFEQLLLIVKTLSLGQKNLLKVELDKGTARETKSNLEALLLSGPVATKRQIDAIKNNRKEVNRWRTK